MLSPVPPTSVVDAYKSAPDLFDDLAMRSEGRWTPAGLLHRFLREDAPWVLHTVLDVEEKRIAAILGTSFGVWDDGQRVCEVHFCTGDGMAEWLPLIADLERWAVIVNDCDRLFMTSRMGWQRMLAPYGYTPRHVELERIIDEQ